MNKIMAAGPAKVQPGTRFIVQSSEVTPEGWKEIDAPTMKEAAIIHLRASKPALADYPIMVYVSDGKLLHPNGAPMCVHGFLFKLNASAARTREEYIAHLSAKLRERGIPHSPAQYDSAGNCLTCGEADRCPGVHTFEEIQAAARRARL